MSRGVVRASPRRATGARARPRPWRGRGPRARARTGAPRARRTPRPPRGASPDGARAWASAPPASEPSGLSRRRGRRRRATRALVGGRRGRSRGEDIGEALRDATRGRVEPRERRAARASPARLEEAREEAGARGVCVLKEAIFFSFPKSQYHRLSRVGRALLTAPPPADPIVVPPRAFAHACVVSWNASSARSMALPSAAALLTVSWYSLSGSESATMPAPACR